MSKRSSVAGQSFNPAGRQAYIDQHGQPNSFKGLLNLQRASYGPAQAMQPQPVAPQQLPMQQPMTPQMQPQMQAMQPTQRPQSIGGGLGMMLGAQNRFGRPRMSGYTGRTF